MTAHTGRRSRLPLALTAAFCLLLTGALAAAAATEASSVTLNLQGGYVNRQLTACSLKHHYTFFHAGNTITMKGSVAPTTPASSWRVKVKVKQCLRGSFRAVWAGYASGHTDGSFKTTYRASRRGFLFARAYYYGATPTTRSDKQYFRVR